jgi:hypothetical protein
MVRNYSDIDNNYFLMEGVEMTATQTITIINRESTEGRESMINKVNLQSYTTVKFAELHVSLHAPDGVPFLGDLGLPADWRITKITVNGIRFDPSGPQESVNKIHDSQGTSFFRNVLKAGEDNTISIFWHGPFGACVTSPHAQISAKLVIQGDEIIPGLGQLGTTLDPTNILDDLGQAGKNATLPTVLLFLGIIVVLVLLAFVLLRAGPVISDAKETTKELGDIVK